MIDSPNRVGSRGLSVPDGVVQSKDQTYTMSMTKLSRGEHFTNLLDEWWELALAHELNLSRSDINVCSAIIPEF